MELPDGTGSVRLASADPSIQLAIDYRYLHHENDIRQMWEGVRLACKILESEAYRDVPVGRTAPADGILASADDLDLWIRQTVGSSRHVSGTRKIEPDSDPMAVVD